MKYTISAGITISIHTTVEAESEGEALAIAKERHLGSVCPSCYDAHTEEWVAEDLDGEIHENSYSVYN